MYFKRKSDVIFRNYGSFGFITDNRNFGYKQAYTDGNDIGEKIVSQSGAVFLSALGKKAQKLDCIVKQIATQFTGADVETIKADASEFYFLLEKDGFVASGRTLRECNEKDLRFSYKNMETKSREEDCAPNKYLEQSTQEFFDEHYNNEPQLTNVHLEIISECNERCVHCYIPHESKTTAMGCDLFYDVLEQCRKMNVLHLTISGGEPMLHKHFIAFLKKCNEYNFSVNVLSNLTLLNKSMIEEMRRNRLLSVQVSLYSMDASIHDAITQRKGSFEKTKNAILKLVENNIPLQISCPIMQQNINSYNEVVDWGKAHNINVGSDYVIIARYNHTTENLNSRIPINDVERVIEQKIANEPKYLEVMKEEAEAKNNIGPDDFVCSVCHSSICITDGGNVYPCAGWQDYVVGNVNRTSIYDIWNKSEKVKYLRNLRRRDFPKCIQCPDNKFCTMCMVRNANEDPSGNPLVVNEFFCNIAKLNKKIVCNWRCGAIETRDKC